MTSRIATITVDARDAYAQSLFWAQVLDFVEDPDDPNLPEHEECLIRSRDGGHALLFIDVPEAKQVKDRVHLDLRPADRSRDEEVERLLAIGATLVADLRREDGSGWVVLADPEGNEFDVLTRYPRAAAAAG